jgi:hypothetical protein
MEDYSYESVTDHDDNGDDQQTDFTFMVDSVEESLVCCIFLEFGVSSDFDLDFSESSILPFAGLRHN